MVNAHLLLCCELAAWSSSPFVPAAVSCAVCPTSNSLDRIPALGQSLLQQDEISAGEEAPRLEQKGMQGGVKTQNGVPQEMRIISHVCGAVLQHAWLSRRRERHVDSWRVSA